MPASRAEGLHDEATKKQNSFEWQIKSFSQSRTEKGSERARLDFRRQRNLTLHFCLLHAYLGYTNHIASPLACTGNRTTVEVEEPTTYIQIPLSLVKQTQKACYKDKLVLTDRIIVAPRVKI